MRLLWHLRPLLLAAALVGCKTPQTAAPPPPDQVEAKSPAREEVIQITLVGTNDLHGWVHPTETVLKDGSVVKEGGVATLAGYLRVLRKLNPGGVLLVDGGDLFQGTLASNLTEGEVVIEAFNRLGYAAAALGNHEFDYGPVGPVSVASDPAHDPFGALKARLRQAQFPLLAVNVYDARSGARPDWLGNDGTTVVEVKGVKVGIVGFITPQTPFTTNPVNVSTLRFGSLVPEALEGARRVRARGAEIVIGIAHAGGKCASCDDPHDLSSCDTQHGEIFEMVQGVPEGTFDAVVAGHTHAELAHVVNGTPVIETRGLGRSFGTLELFVDPKTRRLLKDRTQIGRNVAVCAVVDEATGSCDGKALKKAEQVKLVPATFRGHKVEADPALQALIQPALALAEAAQHRKLGLTAPSSMGRNYEAESALGNFLADSLRQMESADVALLNSGGLRADLPAGELAYGDVYEVIPFDNTVATLTMTGEELKRLMHVAYGARKGVFQISGLKVTISRCPGQGRLKSFSLPDGRPIDPDKRYRVVLPDFLARGGDGLGPVMSSLPPNRIDLGMTRELNFRDALVAYWQKKAQPLVAPEPGRITIVEPRGGCSPGETLSQH